jgi:preprotein translocase subunit SecG
VTFLLWLLAFVELLTSFFLISAILIQKTKAQGAGLAFGASMGESLFGSQAGNFLTRTTVILAVVFLVNTVLLGMIGVRRSSTSVVDRVAPVKEAVAPAPQPRPASPEMPKATPDFGAPPVQAPLVEQPASEAPEAPAAPAPEAAPPAP